MYIVSGGYYGLDITFFDHIFLGCVFGILALTGDLIASFLKRAADIKDFGSILKSHGGLLDRLDSLLLIYPFIYWYALEYYAWTHNPDYDFNKVHILNFFHWHHQ